MKINADSDDGDNSIDPEIARENIYGIKRTTCKNNRGY